jgi:hypothetical protein
VQIHRYILLCLDPLQDCTITGARATNGNGGCIYVDSTATVSLIKSVLTGCRATSNGGGVHVQEKGTLEVTSSNITGCTSVKYGGGVWAEVNASIILDSARFTGNTALEGGGLYLSGTASLGILGVSSFINKNASFIGGGVRLYSTMFDPAALSARVISKGNKAPKGFTKHVSFAARAIEVADTGNADNYIPSANGGDGLHFTLNVSGPHGLPSDDEVELALIQKGTNYCVSTDKSVGETGDALREVAIYPQASPGVWGAS